MKKLTYLGLVAMMTISMTACGNKDDSSAAVAEASPVSEVQQATPDSQNEEATALMLSSKDFEPFFKTVFSLSEDQFDLINKDEQVDAEDYFDNLRAYKAVMETTFGKYFSSDLMDKLKNQSIKLDIDLPKKSQINDYVTDASGDVKAVEVRSSRTLGDETLYEVAVTTTNKVMPYNEFAEAYVWSDKDGYYVKGEPNLAEGLWAVDKHSDEPSYSYADGENMVDQIKLVSSFWVSVIAGEDGSSFKISDLKQAGNLQVDVTDKQKLDNTDYIERIPYYEEVSNKEKAAVSQLFKILMDQPQETYQYYEKVYGNSFELTKTFWEDIQLVDLISIKEDSYQTAFKPDFNPYKNDIVKLTYDGSKLQIKPSIFSSQLQPAFVVTLPVQVITENNDTVYYLYKYYVGMDNGKIETIQFLKMNKITADQYTAGVSSVNEQPAEEESDENPEAAPATADAQEPSESGPVQ